MNLFTLTGELLLRGTDEAKREITDVTSKAEQSESRMSKAFKKIGAVVAGAFAIDKIKDFGVSIVNASAEVSAEMSAFEQIMGSYSDTAQKKLNEVADNTGVVSTRLTPYMTSLTAKFKGLGNDIETSTDLASRGLYLASDASAFWDKSLEDSMSALNSFINGSYEGGEAIGLFANDTQLAQFAIQQGVVESTKDWSALDEATKQATRLEYAENMMKASGATGQASKEAGQYANVQANLTETWRQFKAQIGEPLLQNVVIPAMNALQGVVQTLSDKWKQLTQWVSENKETIEKWVDILIIAGTVIGAYVLVAGTMSILQTVGTWIKSVATAQTLLNAVMSANPIALVVAVLAGLVVAFVKAYNESETFRNIVNKVASAVKDAWNATVEWFKGLPETFKNIWTSVKTKTETIWNSIRSKASSIWSSIKTNVVNLVTSMVNGVKTWFSNMKTNVSNILNTIRTTTSNVWNSIKTSVVNAVTNLVNNVKNKFNSFKTTVSNIWNSIKSTATNVWNGLKSSIVNIASNAVSSIKSKFDNFKNTVSGIWNTVKNNVVNAIKELPSKMLSIGSDIVKGLWNGINDMTDWIVGKVKGFGDNVLSGIKNFFGIKSPSKVFAEIGKFLAEGLGIGIEDNSDYAVEAVEELGEETTSGIQGFMDKLGEKFSSNPVMRRIGQAFGFEFEEGLEETLPKIEEKAEEIPTIVAEAVEENSDEPKKSFNEMFMGIAESAYTYTSKAMDYLTGIGDAIYDYNNQQLNNEINTKEAEIKALQDATDEKLEMVQDEHGLQLELLKDQYDQGLLEQKEYNKQKEILAKELTKKTKALQDEEKAHEEKLAKERDALQKKQFEAKKKNDIAQVWVNFATATMRAFAENWWGTALAITTALGVQAGIQTATINSQQYTPALAKGGIVEDATFAQIGEDGREAVVPLEKNTEWVGGLAKAISPAVVASSQSNSEEVKGLREEIVELRRMLSEYLTQILDKNTDVVINGESLAYALAPSIDSNLGTINRLRARGV